jgi:hypothetical protein
VVGRCQGQHQHKQCRQQGTRMGRRLQGHWPPQLRIESFPQSLQQGPHRSSFPHLRDTTELQQSNALCRKVATTNVMAVQQSRAFVQVHTIETRFLVAQKCCFYTLFRRSYAHEHKLQWVNLASYLSRQKTNSRQHIKTSAAESANEPPK